MTSADQRLYDEKHARSALHRSEAYLAEAQRLSRTGSFGWNVSSGEIYWSEETYKIFEFDRAVKPTLELVFQRIHPDECSKLSTARPRQGQILILSIVC